MKIFTLGATGATGRLFIDRALTNGHQVTALVRSPEKIASRANLSVIAGDVLDATAMADAMRETEVVVSALGLRSARPDHFSEKAVGTIVTAAESAGVTRVVILSAFGVGESASKASAVARLMYSLGGKAIYADKLAGERRLTASALDWTLAYPVLLTDGPASDRFQAIPLDQLDRVAGLPRVSRTDVAGFLLEAATTEHWSQKTAVLTTA